MIKSVCTTVRAKLLVSNFIFCLAIIILGAYSYAAMNSVKVGGALYNSITQTMNIRADILPPPQYLIETELTAMQMAEEASAKASHPVLERYEQKLHKLEKDFEDGQQSWSDQLKDDSPRGAKMRTLLLENNAASARAYFHVLFNTFVPAVYAGNTAAVHDLLQGKMKELADEHRAVIDQITQLSDQTAADDEVNAKQFVAKRMRISLLVLTVLLVVAIGFAFFTYRAIFRPVDGAIQAVKQFEGGNLNARIEDCSADELGSMCDSLNRAIAAVGSTVKNTIESSANLKSYSQTLSSVAASVNAGVEKQASSLEQTSARLGDIATLSQTVAHSGREGQEAAMQSSEAAETGVRVVHAAISGMTVIDNVAAEITQIIDVIDEISFNTNLLAVNASIESAIAGEQGRGFMVVADEIRGLSHRTASAGKKIRKLIQDTQQAIAEGTTQVKATGEAFDEIKSRIVRLRAIMNDVATSSVSQAESLEDLRKMVAHIAAVVDQNSAGTRTLNDTAHNLAKEAQNMQELVGGLHSANPS